MAHHQPYKLTGHIGIDVYRAARVDDTHTVKRLFEEFISHGGNLEGCFVPNHRDEVMFELWGSTGNTFLLDILEPFGIPWTARSAVYWGRQDVLITLISENPDLLNGRYYRGRTLMYHALSIGRGQVAAAHGASVDGCPNERTPLHHECNHGWIKLVPCLLELGADPNARDPIHHGRTALHLAAQRKNTAKLVNLLLTASADPTAIDDNGDRPIDIAHNINAVRLVEILSVV